MAAGAVFPAFIRATYQETSDGVPAFERAIQTSVNRARKGAEVSMEQLFQQVQRAVSGGQNDFGLKDMRAAAAAADARAQSARQLSNALAATAAAEADYSVVTQAAIMSTRRLAEEEEQAARSALLNVQAIERIAEAARISSTALGNLATSQREVYAEQARSTNRAYSAQRSVNELVAPGLTRSAANDGAGFSALEQQLVRQQQLVQQLNAGVAEMEQRFARESAEQARAADMATVALLRQTQALEELRRAEAGAANGAAMLNAIMRQTGAGMSFGNSAAASASAFEQHFAEQSRAAQQYARSAAALRAELDPMFLAQQRFDREMDRADDLMRAGAISAREYAAAQLLARQNLQAVNAAIHTQNLGFQDLTRRSGMMRMAYVQAGQQMQDVTISLMGGQRASIVFAQQIPQLAFALSHLGMQADGTQRGIGRIATMLSGPWSIALAGAAYGVGLLVEKLWGQDAASKAAAESVKKHQAAVESLAASIRQSTLTPEEKISGDVSTLDKARQNAIKATRDARQELAAAKQQAELLKELASETPETWSAYYSQMHRVEELEKRFQDLFRKGAQTIVDARLARIAQAERSVSALLDPSVAVQQRFEDEQKRLRKRYEEDNDYDQYKQGLLAATKAREAELAKIRETEKALGKGTEALTRFLMPVEGAVTSGFGARKAPTAGASSFHPAIDIAAPTGAAVRAPAMGVVEVVGFSSSLGKFVVINHGSGTKTRYGHLSDNGIVAKGDIVEQGALIGRVGSTGISTGSHLDYQVMVRGKAVDPRKGMFPTDGAGVEISDAKRDAAQKVLDDAQAKRAAEELERSVSALFSRLDASKAPMIEYGNNIAEINRLFAAGAIDADQRLALQLKAANDNAIQVQRANDAAMEELNKALGGPMQKEVARFNAEQEASLHAQIELARQAQTHINQGLQQISDFFGNDVARMLDRLSASLSPDSELNQLLSGIGVGRDKMWDSLGEQVSGALKKSGINAEGLGQTLGQVMAGAEMGRLFGKGFTDIFGIKGSKLGSEIGGAIGSAIGGPIGAVVGGTIGSITGGLFKTAKWGTAAVTGNSDSDVSVSGNKAAYRSNSSLAGTSIQSGLDAIAEQFGVNVGNYSVSIGQYKNKWRVSTTGRTGKLKGGSNRTDIKDFGEDGAEDAIKYAIADAVKDGALIGLRASTQALLAASDDVEAQLQKALDFESVFSRLKAYKDPVGAALDTLDKEFKRLQNIFEEAGASAAEYAELEELYGIERAAAVKEAAEQVTASLQSLFDSLTVGNDARSLRDRLAEAQANYDPLAARVAAGDTTAYDDYAEAAQTLLDLQREISGSGEDYFALLDQVTALTKSRIDEESNIASISAARESLFASDSSLAPVVSATETQTATLVSVLTSQLGSQTTELQTISANLVSVGRILSSMGMTTSEAVTSLGRGNF